MVKFFLVIHLLTVILFKTVLAFEGEGKELSSRLENSVRAEIRFDNQIELSTKTDYHLSDLIRFKSGSASLLAELENQIVDLSAIKDNQISSTEIRKWILNLQSVSEVYRRENAKLTIPAMVNLKFTKGPSQMHIARLVQNRTQVLCEPCEVQVTSLSGLDRLRGQSWNLDLSNIRLAPSLMLPLVENEQKPNAPAQFISSQIRIKKLLWVTNKQIPFNTRIEASDLEQRMTDVSFAKEVAVTKDQILGSLTTRSLMTGSPIFPADLKREAAIKKAQLIRAIAGDSELEVTTSATAEENGFIGDTIKIKTVEGNKVLSGLIVEKGTVRLQ